MDIQLRRATPQDIDAIYNISTSVHLGAQYQQLIPPNEQARFVARYTPSDERREAYRQKFALRLEDKDWLIWVAECDGIVCGYRVLHLSEKTLELYGLFIDEAYQGKGIGRKLFETWQQYMRPGMIATLQVLEGNERAIHLYKTAGFEIKGFAEKTYYGARLLQMYKD